MTDAASKHVVESSTSASDAPVPLTLVEAPRRDHGGGVDAALARWGGAREDWLDLSTGINPIPYPLPPVPDLAWTSLPDRAAEQALLHAARAFWRVPDGAEVVAAPGLSALIAQLPQVALGRRVAIPGPTYNEYAAAFLAAGRVVLPWPGPFTIVVHPNNPDGRLWAVVDLPKPGLLIVDESFCDVAPWASHVARSSDPGVIVLKSFGKFWGLAGLRLGFAILRPGAMADRLRGLLGPWPVSGPALAVGAAALADEAWAERTRARLAADADRLDALLMSKGAEVVGGTTLFRLYAVPDAQAWHDRLARGRVLSRVFPYSSTWLRLGLPDPDRWPQLEAALDGRP